MSRRADARHTSPCALDKRCSCFGYQQGHCHLSTIKSRKGSHALFLRLLRAELASASGSSPGELIPMPKLCQVYLGPWKRKISGFPKHGVMRTVVSRRKHGCPDNAVNGLGSLLQVFNQVQPTTRGVDQVVRFSVFGSKIGSKIGSPLYLVNRAWP